MIGFGWVRSVKTWVGEGGEEKGWLLVEVSGRRPERVISNKFPLVRATIDQFGTINTAIYKGLLTLNGLLR